MAPFVIEDICSHLKVVADETCRRCCLLKFMLVVYMQLYKDIYNNYYISPLLILINALLYVYVKPTLVYPTILTSIPSTQIQCHIWAIVQLHSLGTYIPILVYDLSLCVVGDTVWFTLSLANVSKLVEGGKQIKRYQQLCWKTCYQLRKGFNCSCLAAVGMIIVKVREYS